MAGGRGPRAVAQGSGAVGRVLDSIQELASWLYRRQISPAPMAIFNKLCEILVCLWIYEIYVDLLIAE